MAAAPTLSPAVPAPVLSFAGEAPRDSARIARAEFIFLGTFALILCLLTTLPRMLAWTSHFPGSQFSGVLSHSLDSNNYLAYVQQSASGAWIFRNPMTPEPHAAVFFNLEWLVAGKIAAAFSLSPADAIDVERLFCVCLMCFAVYWLAAHLFRSVILRRVATIAVMTGGGFGWMAAVHVLHVHLDSSYFLDLTNGNLFPFYWALKLPHFLISESLVVLGLGLFVHGEQGKRTSYVVGAGACYALAGMCRPYDMLYAMTATALFVIVRATQEREFFRRAWKLALPIVICAPLLGYYFWIFKLHPVFHWWSNPGNPAPSVWLLAVSYGPSFLVFLFALTRLRRTSFDSAGQFMMCCFVTAALLTYTHHWFHFAFQFATNILLPMLMVAFILLEELVMKWMRKSRGAKAILIPALFLNSLTALALTAQLLLLVRSGDFRTDSNLVRAYSWISNHSERGEIVLADFENSGQLPQYSHNVVFCGYINAVEFEEKYKRLTQFLDARTPDDVRQKLLNDYPVRYVLLTPAEERQLASAGRIRFLAEQFRNDAAVVFATGTPFKQRASQ